MIQRFQWFTEVRLGGGEIPLNHLFGHFEDVEFSPETENIIPFDLGLFGGLAAGAKSSPLGPEHVRCAQKKAIAEALS